MNTSSNGYVLGFAVTVCVVMSSMLAFTATQLKPAQDAAAEFDRQKNVLMAAGLATATDTRSQKDLEQLYKERISELVVDTVDGTLPSELTPRDVEKRNADAAANETDKAMKKAAQTRYRVIAVAKGDDGTSSYVLPISGKGLWSTIYGYLALANDATTVKGVTFYKHGETPGLGGECENPAWCATWQGKSILDESKKLVGVIVKKGKVDEAVPEEKRHKVDGLSGATITSDGITKFVKSDLAAFEPYLASLRK
jgi:Na+-transporting NADH:ubiquinone oxidoreductase subunit C